MKEIKKNGSRLTLLFKFIIFFCKKIFNASVSFTCKNFKETSSNEICVNA